MFSDDQCMGIIGFERAAIAIIYQSELIQVHKTFSTIFTLILHIQREKSVGKTGWTVSE